MTKPSLKRIALLLGLYLILCFVAARAATLPAAPGSATAADPPVARVNGSVLTERDLQQEERMIFPYAQQHGGSIPKDLEPGIRAGALQMIIFEELVYQEAERRHWNIPAWKLDRARGEIRLRFASAAAYAQFLKAQYQGSESILRAKIRRSMLIDRLLAAEVAAKSTVTERELRDYYKQNLASFRYPESFAIQTISIIPSANATPAQLQAARVRAQDALRKANATKTAMAFGLLAEQISDDDYRVMLGDHKWVPRDQMPPPMYAAAAHMRSGGMSGIVQVENNFVIFRMNRHLPAGAASFAQVETRLRSNLRHKKTEALRAALDQRLRKDAKIETP